MSDESEFDRADVLYSTTASGEVRVNLGYATEGQGIQSAGSFWGPDGYIARPNPPTDGGGACEALYWQNGDQKIAFASRDHRYQQKMSSLKDGDRAIVSNCSARFILKQADSSIFLYTTTDGTEDGRACYLKVGKEGLDVSTPWGRMTLGPLGFHVLHNSGARLDLGAIGGISGPLSSLGSYATLDAGMVSVKGGATSLGTDAGIASQAAIEELIAVIGQLVDAISQITASTPGAAALATALLPPDAAATVTLLTPLLAPIGKVV